MTLDAALDYAQRGWRVLPIRPGEKRPLTEHGFKDASAEPGRIEEWWHRWPDAGVGIATGDLLVLDVDARNGGDDALHELEQQHGRLPETVRVKTGGGGEHFYFANPNGIGCSAGRLGPGLDVRGHGGCVVAPPSAHPSGRPYAWDVAPGEAAIADPPEWMIERLNAPQRATGEVAPGGGEVIPKGRRDSTLLSLAGSMRRVGMTASEIYAALVVVNRERCEEPVADAKLRELADRAGNYVAGAPHVPTPDAEEAARELSDLLQLSPMALAVTGARIVGRGREASADLYLSNGESIYFPKLPLTATVLCEAVVVATGAEPALKNPDARHAVALMRKVGVTVETQSDDDRARGWGRDFLEAVESTTVRWDDGAERWRAFALLRDRNPYAEAKLAGESLAQRCLVPSDTEGRRYVRTSWFRSYVKTAEDHTIAPERIANMMLRVGWTRPGKEGRIKARRPGFSDTDVQAFYVVPADWDEDEDEDEGSE